MQFLKTIIADNRLVIRNILLGLYYLLAHHFLSNYSFDNRLQLPYWAACLVLLLLIIEPISIRLITGNEAFKSKKTKTGLPIGIISGAFIAIARIVFRLLFLLAALPTLFPSYHFDHPSTIYILVVLLLSEVMTFYALAKPRLKSVSTLTENVHQFILWNISCLFLFIFDESLMRHILLNETRTDQSIGMMVFFSAFLFLIFYLPNRIIEIYSDWIDLHGLSAKTKYLLSVLWLYALMLATN